MLSISGKDFITCWAYADPKSLHTEEQFLHVQSMLIIRGMNFIATLSIRGTNFIACWAYSEPVSSHAEHARKCLKVKYLGWIEYDCQKSCVTGPWDHMVSVSAKKVFRKISCLCTFQVNIGDAVIKVQNCSRPMAPSPASSWVWVSELLLDHCKRQLRRSSMPERV